MMMLIGDHLFIAPMIMVINGSLGDMVIPQPKLQETHGQITMIMPIGMFMGM
jgi:hypothetical protein